MCLNFCDNSFLLSNQVKHCVFETMPKVTYKCGPIFYNTERIPEGSFALNVEIFEKKSSEDSSWRPI